MADVRCPMCGKTNPAEAKKCQFCQARLEPLGSKSGSNAAASEPVQPGAQPSSGAEDNDWLRELLGSDSTPEPAKDSTEQPAQETGEGSPDWLERIRQRTQEEQDAISKIGPKPNLDAVHGPDAESASTASELEKWLKSLEEAEGTQPPASQVPPPAAPVQNTSEDDDDWLRTLTARMQASQSMEDHLQTFRGGKESGPEQPPAEPADTGELPDWLQNLKAEPAETPAEEPSNWLKDFGKADEDSIEVSADDLPDWVKNVPGQGRETAEPAPEAAAADEIPDWLRELREEAPAPEAPQETAAPSEELPDWLSTAEQPQGSAGAEELPDWLNDLKLNPPETENLPPAQTESPIPAEELPDWLKELQPAAEAPSQPEPAESLPDWMNEATPPVSDEGALSAAETAEPPQWMSALSAPAEEVTSPSGQEERELPDWLGDLQAAPPPETAQAPADETSQPAETFEGTPTPFVSQPEAEMPDWLKVTGPLSLGAVSTPDEPTAEAQPAAETPDWLKDLGPLPTDAVSTPDEPTAEAQPAAETPDWLQDFGTLPGAEEEPSGSAASISSWLASLDEPQESAAQASASISDEAAPAEDIPDWLKAIKTGSQPDNETASSFGPQGLPEWMSNPQEIEGKWEEPSPSEAAPAEGLSPFASREMDALLAGVTPPESAAEPQVTQGEPEALEPAQLPSWLQAMRPVASAVSDIPAAVAADDQRIEKSGPLAGLRGVLPVEEIASIYRKLPVYTNKLQVSEKQHLHSNLLESILADEKRAQPVSREASQASQTILRLLVAALLIFLVYVPALTGFNLAVPADLSSSQPGVAQAFQSISELGPGANILLAADFEAGLTGEITTAALPVLKFLQMRQPNVFLASTVPAGPVLGELLLSQASISPAARFGYIAGGTHALKMIGAHATAEQPAPLQQVIPFPNGQAWTGAALRGIKDITSFQRILVLTDSLENARAWVEQVQPGLGPQTQILIISSAQVAPLVRTYAESGQVSGVVSGLAGGTAFEQLSQQSGPGSASWTAYQLTMGAVILLIIAGALFTGISSLLQPEKSKRKV